MEMMLRDKFGVIISISFPSGALQSGCKHHVGKSRIAWPCIGWYGGCIAVIFAIFTVPFHCPHVVNMDGHHLVRWVTAAHYSVGPRYLGVHNFSFPE
jgi:hypothetical protein